MTALDAVARVADARPMTKRKPPAAAPALPDGVEEAIVLALFDLANQLVRRGDELAAAAGLTTQQWLVLLHVAGDPNFPSRAGRATTPVLPSEIARVRGVSRATVSAVVAALRRRGLITDAPDPADGRRRQLALTDRGAEAIAQIQPLRRAANQRLLAAVAPAARAQFLRYLTACLDQLWDAREAAPPPATPGRPRRRPQ